jgi:hypothetical protein
MVNFSKKLDKDLDSNPEDAFKTFKKFEIFLSLIFRKNLIKVTFESG